MKVIVPIEITDTTLVSCSIPETDHAAWSGSTPYSIGARVIRPTTHTIYEALTANTGKTPESNPLDWMPVGPTNRWGAFDRKVGTKSSAVGNITYELSTGIVDSIALLGLTASSVTVQVEDTVDGLVFDRTYNLVDNSNVVSWHAYFFSEILKKEALIVKGLPSYASATTTISIDGGAEEVVQVGSIVIGRMNTYAVAVRPGASLGIQDFSRKERDDYGNFDVREGAFSKRANWSFTLENSRIDQFVRTMAKLRAKPAVYIGSEDYTSAVIYGFYQDFDVVIPYPTLSECSLSLEELT